MYTTNTKLLVCNLYSPEQSPAPFKVWHEQGKKLANTKHLTSIHIVVVALLPKPNTNNIRFPNQYLKIKYHYTNNIIEDQHTKVTKNKYKDIASNKNMFHM